MKFYHVATLAALMTFNLSSAQAGQWDDAIRSNSTGAPALGAFFMGYCGNPSSFGPDINCGGPSSGNVLINLNEFGREADILSLQLGAVQVSTGLAALQTQANLTQATVSGQGTSINALNGTVGSLQTTVNGQGTSINALNGTVGSLQTTVTGQGTSITALNGSVGTLQTTVNGQGASINVLNGTVGGLQTTVNGQGTSINNLQIGLGALQVQVNGLTPTVNASLASFQSQINNFAVGMAQLSDVLHKEALRSDQGVAMALASGGGVELQTDEHFAVAMNVGTFRGQNGGAVGAAYRIDDHVSVNASFVSSLNGGAVGARAGIRFGW